MVEFHAFMDNDNNYIIKELAIVSNHFFSVTVFKPPYSFEGLNSKAQRTARWLQRHHHCIRWGEGGVTYNEDLIRILCKPFAILYTKGLEKAKFLRRFHRNVLEVDSQCKVSERVDFNCVLSKHNKKDSKCALRSAKCYYDCLKSVCV